MLYLFTFVCSSLLPIVHNERVELSASYNGCLTCNRKMSKMQPVGLGNTRILTDYYAQISSRTLVPFLAILSSSCPSPSSPVAISQSSRSLPLPCVHCIHVNSRAFQDILTVCSRKCRGMQEGIKCSRTLEFMQPFSLLTQKVIIGGFYLNSVSCFYWCIRFSNWSWHFSFWIQPTP